MHPAYSSVSGLFHFDLFAGVLLCEDLFVLFDELFIHLFLACMVC